MDGPEYTDSEEEVAGALCNAAAPANEFWFNTSYLDSLSAATPDDVRAAIEFALRERGIRRG